MEKYESICTVGEGSYGVVLKCKDKTNGSIVAIKKFLETENDKAVKKIATREIKILKTLRHENLVNLIEVFRRSRRIYLVFEFIEQNLLEEIERSKVGLGEAKTKEIMYQVVRGVDFMHSNNIIHRDIKPENVLINKNGLVKLCDFGFARHIAQPTEMHTDYVATRWYRSPELLVGDTKYGKPVDVWSIGVLTYEVLTSRPLFPGESDLDQLFLIMNSLGDITESMKICFQNNQFYLNVKLPRIKNFVPLQNRLRRHSSPSLTKFIMDCLIIDPQKRLTTVQLLEHELFTNSHWIEDFLIKLRKLVSMHETSIYRSSLHHTRVTRQSQQQQPQNRTHQQAAAAAAHSLPSDNTPSSLTIDASAIGPTTVGYNGNGKATTNKASSESLNQSDMSTTVTLPGPGQSHQPNQNHYHTNANNNVNHHHPMMNKVNITFSNLNTESKASFTSNITNESNNLMMKKNNPKMISDSLGVVKQSQQYPTKESSYGQEVNVNKNKNFLPKIERKTPESPKLDLQTNSLKTMNQQSNHVYKSQHLQQQQQQQQQSMQMNNGPSKLNYVSFGNNNTNTMNNHHNNPHHNYPSNTHYQQPQQQQQQNQSNKKISSNSVDFNSISTNTNNNQHHINNNNIIDNNLNLNTSSTATLTGIIAGSESMQQFASNSNTINPNNQPSSIQYNHPLMNRSNTNNTIHTPTNLDGGGGGGVYIIDENYRLNNNSTNGNGNSVKKQQPSNNHMNHMNHHHTNGSNPDVFSPSNNNPLASNASNSSSKSQHNKEVKFNTSTNVNSLRLPQVKPIEMYTKTNKNFLYENKKAVLMQINNKK